MGAGHLPNSKLHFNVSHADDLIAIAITELGPIGIDVEHRREISNRDDLVDSTFDELEKQCYFSADEAQRNDLFLGAFSQKEACLKNVGVGLLLPMTQVHTSNLMIVRGTAEVDLSKNLNGKLARHTSTNCIKLQMYPLNLPDNFVGAIAVKDSRVKIEQYGFGLN